MGLSGRLTFLCFFFGTPPSVTFFFSLAAFPSLSLSLSTSDILSLAPFSLNFVFFFVIIIFLCSELSLRLM